MNEIIPIVYNGGAYGTYLYYILDTHSNKGENINGENPIFTATGECAYKRGSGKVIWPEYAIAKWRTFINNPGNKTFFKIHRYSSSIFLCHDEGELQSSIADTVRYSLAVCLKK